MIDVITEFENNEFLLDKLGPGSAINYRAVFLKDQMYVNFEAASEVKILYLPYQKLMDMVNKHGSANANVKGTGDSRTKELFSQRVTNFSTRVLIASNRYLKGERSYPVDYIKK